MVLQADFNNSALPLKYFHIKATSNNVANKPLDLKYSTSQNLIKGKKKRKLVAHAPRWIPL
jgi:hypothetical protein